MCKSVVTIASSPERFGAVRDDRECALFPSSMNSDDRSANELKSLRGSTNRLTTIRIPQRRGPFRRVALPESSDMVRLDQSLVGASFAVVVIDLDEAEPTGPFALDLAACFLSPIDRARLLLSRDKLTRIARLNTARVFASYVIRRTFRQGTVWIETDDGLAAELVALAFSEDRLPANRLHPSPWEDELVQRTTEFGIGVRYGGDIRLRVDDDAEIADINEAVAALHLRLGIDISSIPGQYGKIL